MDSVSADRNGAFELRVPEASAEGGEVYFASVRWDGVLYFGDPITSVTDPDTLYVVQAYPAAGSSGGSAPLPLQVRNLFLESAESGAGWRVTDFYQLRNASSATHVSSESGPTWSYPLPPGAVEFAVGQSDLDPRAATLSSGRVHVSAAFPPGERVYVLHYRVPSDRLSVPMEGPTGSMELLIREPAGEVSVLGLAAADPVDFDGTTYRRFAGRELAPATVVVQRGDAVPFISRLPFLAAVLAMALALAGAVLAVRAPSAPAVPAAAARRQAMIQIAELDEARVAGQVASEEYARRRQRLLRQIDP